MTLTKHINAEELLQSLALGQAAGAAAVKGLCRIAVLPADGWEIKAIREVPFVTVVRKPDELRDAVTDPKTTFILVPADAMIGRQTLDDACHSAVLKKTIICEGDI